MTIWFKKGVLGDPSHAMIKARGKIAKVYAVEYGQADLYVTAIRDGNHGDGSLHDNGNAEDYRYPESIGTRAVLKEYLRKELGPDYDIIIHGDHLHVEYDPKG